MLTQDDTMASSAMRNLEADIKSAVQSDCSIMISGDRGTGKKFIAHRIHEGSRRRKASFVIANGDDLSDGLSTTARNGTLLIDELDTFGAPMQLRLLTLIESEMASGGGVRIMTATTADMFERVRTCDFREDLFYRLNVIHLIIPPLRDRREDIPILFQHYLSCFADADVPALSPAALQRVVEYAWPGNVQELKATAEMLAVNLPPGPVSPDDLPSHIRASPLIFD